jgi:small neutral amino acid transporter SnatA (MarC family)
MLVGVYGLGATLAAVIVNIGLAAGVLLTADRFSRLLGKAGSQALSKVASLILTAIAIMLIRTGLEHFITAWPTARGATP